MSTATSSGRTALRTYLLAPLDQAILTAWPNVTRTWQLTQSMRSHWANRVQNGEKPPIVIVHVGALEPTTTGPADALNLRTRVTITYAHWGEGEVSGFESDGDLFPTMAEVGLQLVMVLSGAAGAFSFQVVDGTLGANPSPSGEAMAYLSKWNVPLDAVEVTFDAILSLAVPAVTLVAVPS
jgi:hypothetical protein